MKNEMSQINQKDASAGNEIIVIGEVHRMNALLTSSLGTSKWHDPVQHISPFSQHTLWVKTEIYNFWGDK